MTASPAITFVGTGAAFDPVLPNTSMLYRGARTLLLDCGYRVPHALWALPGGRDPELLDGVWISHVHADHSFGLPALLLWMRLAERTRPLEIFGGPGVGRWLRRLLELGYPGSYAPEKCFPIVPRPVSPRRALRWGPLRLSVARSDHSVRNLSLRIDEGSASFAYSGDGAPTEATAALFAGVDLLVHECFAADVRVHGHAALVDLLPLARDAGVATLGLIHLHDELGAGVRALAAAQSPPPRLLIPAPGDVAAVRSTA